MARDVVREAEVDARLKGCGRAASVVVILLGVLVVALVARIALG